MPAQSHAVTQVPFLDLKTQYQQLKAEILPAVERVLDDAAYVLGPSVQAFEGEFARYAGAEFAIGVNNGTSALQLALLALGVGAGDEVVVPAHTFVATAAAVGYVGARAVLVDVDPRSYTMDPARLADAITPRTRAVMPVHLYGLPADMAALGEVAGRHGVPIVEDAAQAHGAEVGGRRCGSLGALAGFSFYPGKNLGAYGEAGAVTTSDPGLARRVRMLRDWGQERKYEHVIRGYNMRMEGVQGAVLGVKLRHIDGWTERRRAVAAMYDGRLAGAEHVRAPEAFPDRRHVYHLYVVRVADREGFMAHMAEWGVQTSIHYPTPVHLLAGYADLGYGRGDFPVAERVAAECVSLPMYPEMSDEQAAHVAEAALAWGGPR